MMDSLLKRIESNRKAHARWIAMVLCLSMLVSLGTFAGFHKTAVAKVYTIEVLDCPYTHEGAEPVAHTHNDDCYDGDTLVCSLPEIEAHSHSDECFAENEVLCCTLEENPGHQHTESCYTEREELRCGLEENPGHQHTATCYNADGALICTIPEGEGAHTHTPECYETVRELTCTIPEGEGAHTHTAECYETVRELICDKPELPVHVHGPECFRTEEVAVGEEEKTVPEIPVGDPNADLETASDWERDFDDLELSGNWTTDLVLVAATQQGHGESPNNFEAVLNDAGDAWVRHGYTRYGAWYGAPYAEEWSAMFVSFCLRYAGIPAEFVRNNPTAALMAESFSKGELFAGRDYVPAVGDLIFFDTGKAEGIDHMGIVYYVDEENGTINTVEGSRSNAVETFGYHLDDEEIIGYGILPQNPNDVPAEEEDEDEAPDSVIVMTTDEEESEEKKENEKSKDTVEETVPAVPMPAQSWERTAGGIKVVVEAPEGAFPENTTIAVTPVNGNSLKDTVSDAVNGEVLEVQAVDITFFTAEGQVIEPAIPIRVVMTPAETQHAEEKANVVHIDLEQQTAEVITQAEGTETDNSEVVFDAEAFTIYAIVYTYQVDFEYEVDGKVFTSSIPGAENMTLAYIVEGLGIVSGEEIDTFVYKIASVTSTNEEVAVVTENREIRVLKDGDAQIVITMQDGAVFRIDVKAEGETEVSDENQVAVISTVNDLFLPADAEAKAEVLTQEESENAIAAVQAREETDESNSSTKAAYQVFEISLNNVDTEKYDGFTVEVKLPENVVGRDFRLFHIHDGDTEEVELKTVSRPEDDTGLEVVSGFTFETKDFSEFVLKYTVDFHYEINGQVFEFSIPGGGFVSLEHLIEVLGVNIHEVDSKDDASTELFEEEYNENSAAAAAEEIEGVPVTEAEAANGAENVNTDAGTAFEQAINLNNIPVSEETKAFVANIETVEFSSPELVWIGKIEEESLVGAIKEANGLEAEYSTELTEDQIAEINAQTVEAEDWALISIHPFMSEESLTITMKNGDSFSIRVTDGQIRKTVISAGGENYEITVTYGDEARIPDGAELRIEEILPEDEKYTDYYQKSLEKVGVSIPEEDAEEAGYSSDTDVLENFVADYSDLTADGADEEQNEAPLKKLKSDYARIFDIEIWADDQKVEPASEVTVSIRLLNAPEDAKATPQVVHFAKDGTELIELKEQAENRKDEGIQFVTDEFSVYSVVYTVDFSYEINGKVYSFSMQGADSVSLRELLETLHVFEKPDENKVEVAESDAQTDAEVAKEEVDRTENIQNNDLDEFMKDIVSVTFSNPDLLVPAKVKETATVGKIKTALKLFPTYPLGLSQEEVLELNAKEYDAGDWVLISLKPFDTQETLTIVMVTGEVFTINVTDAQNAQMIGDQVQTVSNPAGTTIDLFDYWIVSQDLVGRDAWGDLNQGWGGHSDNDGLNGSGNNKGINSSTSDSEHGHALKFSPAWEGTVFNGTKNDWTSLNSNGRDGLSSYTGNGNPFQGIVQGSLSNGFPVLTNNGTIGSNGESLAYLFDPQIGHVGKASYAGVDQLLYVDPDGYYTYDSRDYRADYNDNGTFTLTEQTSDNTEIRGFWPFGTQNFWIGMHVNTQFSMPANGQVLNPRGVYKDMQFEFSGDDDTWLYVDGVLVGDGGGIHNRTEIDINFANGTVTVTGKKDANHAGDFEETKFLDDIFRAAGKFVEDDWEDIPGSEHKRFKAGTYHTFDMFYLERGGGESNLYIHYNLVSTADFTAHKAYYGADETDILKRDQFQFELIGLDGKYHSIKNPETGNYDLDLVDPDAHAIMPHASGTGEGTVASPHYEDNVLTSLATGNVNSQVYITGVTEDGNVNFGTAEISQDDMNDADHGYAPVYKYIIREIVPDDAVNADGITWASANEEQKKAGGFIKNQVTYDGTVYYMTGRVTSWQETDPSGQPVTRHGISKTYFTDDTYTTVNSNVNFASFENRFVPVFGNVNFKKVDGAGHPLQGASFALYKDEACKIPALDLDTEGHPAWTATSDADGIVSFESVRVGTYYMKETEAPEEYALDKAIYKVVIQNSKDQTKKSKITMLEDETETEVNEIANAKSGKITVLKKWLDSSGAEIDGGNNSATVQLKRRHMVAEESTSVTHTVTVQMTVEDGGVHSGPVITQSVQGDTIVIEWDDEWQRNFNWILAIGNKTYEGWIGNEFVQTDDYMFEQIDIDGRSRRLTILNAQGDVSLTTKYWVTWLHSDSNHWNNLNNPVISSTSTVNYITQEDEAFNSGKHTQLLSGSSWSHTWSVGGTESSYSGFDYPAIDDNGKNYLYYVVELDTQGNEVEIGGNPLEGYILRGYTANNNIGISDQGTITVFNQSTTPKTINIVVKKTDDTPNSTNFLSGAVFKLLYRADSSKSWIGAKTVEGLNIEQLDEDSQFTVPTEGITLTGLISGQYQLQEITPPKGYLITETYPVVFTVENGAIANTDGTISTVRYTAATQTQDAEFIVPNTPGVELPQTGGIGTMLFTSLGGLMTATAGAILTIRRKKQYS